MYICLTQNLFRQSQQLRIITIMSKYLQQYIHRGYHMSVTLRMYTAETVRFLQDSQYFAYPPKNKSVDLTISGIIFYRIFLLTLYKFLINWVLFIDVHIYQYYLRILSSQGSFFFQQGIFCRKHDWMWSCYISMNTELNLLSDCT